LRFTVYGSQFQVLGSWFLAQTSKFVIQTSKFPFPYFPLAPVSFGTSAIEKLETRNCPLHRPSSSFHISHFKFGLLSPVSCLLSPRIPFLFTLHSSLFLPPPIRALRGKKTLRPFVDEATPNSKPARNAKFTVYGLRFPIPSSWFLVPGSNFKIRNSNFKIPISASQLPFRFHSSPFTLHSFSRPPSFRVIRALRGKKTSRPFVDEPTQNSEPKTQNEFPDNATIPPAPH